MAELRIDQVCSSVIDCEHKTVPEDLYGSAWAVGTPAMTDGRIDFSRAKRISDDTYELWTKRAVPVEGDLILAREAPVGPVVRVPASPKVALGQRTVLLRPRPDVIDSRYLHFLLLSSDMQDRMHSKSEGSTVRHLNVEDVRALPLPPLPPIVEQRAIAGVLGALDDKIESNLRRIAIVKELTHAEFRASVISGSRDGSLGEILRESRIRVSSDGADVVVLSALAEGRLVASDEYFTKRVYSAEIDKYLKVPQWAFAYNPSRINIGSIGLNSSMTVGAVSPVYVVAQAPTRAVARWVEQALQTGHVRDKIVAYSSGSVRQVLRFSDFAAIRLMLPSDAALSNFEDRTLALYDMVDVATQESHSTSILRDALLPELLSGRLRVKDAESIVENV